MIYVLFGPPAVGKTYIGRLLSKKTGTNFFDADKQISKNETILLKSGEYNQKNRDSFITKLQKKVYELSQKYKELIIAEAFTIESNRIDFKNYFKSKVLFINIEAPRAVAKKRAIKRLKEKPHIINIELFNFFWKVFEKPQIEHNVINNYQKKDSDLIKEFLKIKNDIILKRA